MSVFAVLFLSAAVSQPEDARPDKHGLVVFRPQEGECTIRLPAYPRIAYSQTAAGNTRSYRLSVTPKTMIMFSVMPLKDLQGKTREELEKKLDDAERSMQDRGLKVTSSKKAELGEHPGREVRGEKEPGKPSEVDAARTRMVVAKSRLYVLMVFGEAAYVDSPTASAILHSLEIQAK